MRVLVLLIATALVPSLTLAQTPQAGKLRGSINAGTSVFGSGDLHRAATSAIPDLIIVDPAQSSFDATLEIKSNKYSDVYDVPLQFGLEISYGATDDLEYYGALIYSKSSETLTQIGSANLDAFPISFPIFGRFSDLENFGLEIGSRYFFRGTSLRPFIGGSLGVIQQRSISVSLSIPDGRVGGLTIANAPFLKETSSMTAAVEAGIAVNLSEKLGGRLSVGARYIGPFGSDDSALDLLGLGSINNATERWVYPIKASLAASF